MNKTQSTNMFKFILFCAIIININSFTINKSILKQTQLFSKKSNKYNNDNDYFDNEFYEVDYHVNTNYNENKEKYEPKGPNQKKYVNYLNNNDISLLFGLGPAGSGKTLFACLHAIKSLKSKTINKIILTRPIVPVENEEIGFLPGSIQNKMDPWTKPIFDIFLEYYKQSEINNMIKDSIIEICPLAFMRGRTFKNSIIICDEMQNSTPNQMLMLTTRVGVGSKMIIMGDLQQTDHKFENGLSDIITKIKNYKISNLCYNIQIVEMTKSDVQRSKLVNDILNIYK